MAETDKGRSPAEIAKKNNLESSMVETIVRLYLTHPGVTADGIIKNGILNNKVAKCKISRK